MKKKILAVVLSIFAAVLLVGAFAGCSSETQAARSPISANDTVFGAKSARGNAKSAPCCGKVRQNSLHLRARVL